MQSNENQIEASYPNPLQVNFGEGRFRVNTFNDKSGDGFGVIFKDTVEPHPVGMCDEADKGGEHEPERGEVYLHFTNRESLMVVVTNLLESAGLAGYGELEQERNAYKETILGIANDIDCSPCVARECGGCESDDSPLCEAYLDWIRSRVAGDHREYLMLEEKWIGVTEGVEMIGAERRRQIRQERYTSAHDDDHGDGGLARAALCYTMPNLKKNMPPPDFWPWDGCFWKPSDDPIRNLTKAGALIAAEIDRLQRRKKEETE
jgi:hypothetical protein